MTAGEKNDPLARLFGRIVDLEALEAEHDGNIDKVLRWWEARMRFKEERAAQHKTSRQQHIRMLLMKIAAKKIL